VASTNIRLGETKTVGNFDVTVMKINSARFLRKASARLRIVGNAENENNEVLQELVSTAKSCKYDFSSDY